MAESDDRRPLSLSAGDFGEKTARKSATASTGTLTEQPITAQDFDEGSVSYVAWGLLPLGVGLVLWPLHMLYRQLMPYRAYESPWLWQLVILAVYSSLAVFAYRTAIATKSRTAAYAPDWVLGGIAAAVAVILMPFAQQMFSIFNDGQVPVSLRFGGSIDLFVFTIYVLPAIAYAVFRECAIRGVVIGSLEQQGRRPLEIVVIASLFDLVAALTVIASLGVGIAFVLAVIAVQTMIGVSFSTLRVASRSLAPCIAVAVAAVVIGSFVRIV